MTKEELIAQRDKLAKDLLNLRMEKVVGYLDNPIALRTTRRNIARLNTRIHAIEIGIDK
jgi:ribosomal protein L29